MPFDEDAGPRGSTSGERARARTSEADGERSVRPARPASSAIDARGSTPSAEPAGLRRRADARAPGMGNVEPGDGTAAGSGERSETQEQGRLAGVSGRRAARAPEPPDGADEDEYELHTYKVYPSGRPDAVEFIDATRPSAGRASCAGSTWACPRAWSR